MFIDAFPPSEYVKRFKVAVQTNDRVDERSVAIKRHSS